MAMAVQDSSGRWFSQDGRYWWDGRAWLPVQRGIGLGIAAITAAVFLLVIFMTLVAIVSGVLEGRHLVMAVLTATFSVALAVVGGRLAPRAWTPAGAVTEHGASMIGSLWAAIAGLTWAYLVVLTELTALVDPSFARWALGTWLLSPVVSISLLGGCLLFGAFSLWYSGLRSTSPFQWTTGGGGTLSGDGGDLDLRAIVLAVLGVVAGGAAILTVWLIARASARSRGVRLPFASALFGRPPVRAHR